MMIKPRTLIKSVTALTLFVAVCLASGGSAYTQLNAQQQTATNVATDDLARGLELYQKGDDKGAIEALRRAVKSRKDDIAAWHYLGLAYSRQGKNGDARKAHEQAAKSGEELLEQIYNSTPYENVFTVALKYKPLFIIAAESASKYLALSEKPSRSKVEEWQLRADVLREYVELSEENLDSRNKVYSSREVDTKVRILRKPEPQYTDKARGNAVTGTVVLRAIFAFDGRIRAVRVVKGLPDGLTFNAMQAARKIKFIPAMLGGKPVSQYLQIEYNFNVY